MSSGDRRVRRASAAHASIEKALRRDARGAQCGQSRGDEKPERGGRHDVHPATAITIACMRRATEGVGVRVKRDVAKAGVSAFTRHKQA